MTTRALTAALFVGALLTTTASAQFNEVEPNSGKTEATAVASIVAGGTINGTSTGTGTVLGDTADTTVDMFRVSTGPLPLGIYKHTLTLTSAPDGHTGNIHGLTQGTGGVINTTDSVIQTSSTAGLPPRANHWFGFGKQEEIYYRVAGVAATTGAYTATLSTATISPTVVAGVFSSGNITITSVGQTTTDTEIYVYDSALNPLPGYHNDDEGPGGASLQSRLTRFYPGGTYFVAVSDFNLCNNQSDANADEDFQTGSVLDFPNVLVSGDRETGPISYAISISDGGTPVAVPLSGNGEYDIAWAQFTVANIPPSNDACASAAVITNGSSGSFSLATNDGTASCDPGGAASKDLWYSFTAGPFGGTISPTTCGSSGETVLTVFNGCGGAELGCNDDCGGAPCAGPASCLSGLVLAANQVVILRVSDKGTAGGLFTLTMNYVANAPGNDDCSTPLALAGPGTYPFDTTLATAGQTLGNCSSLPGKNLWFTYTPTTSGTVTVDTCNQTTGDTEIWIYDGAGCPAAAAIACNDDSCSLQSSVTFPTVCGQSYTIEVANFSTSATVNISGTFTVSETGTTCSTPSTSVCLGDGTQAACPCLNSGAAGHGCASSAFGMGALLTATGIASDESVSGPTADTLVLTATNIPGPGLFFQSNALVATPINFGDGHLCAAVGLIRLGVVFPTSGTAAFPGGLTPNEIHIQGGALAGQTKFYQCWYRSIPNLCNNPTSPNSNLTQGVTLTWTN